MKLELPMPQLLWLGSQVGTGSALTRTPADGCEAFARWVEATAPVTTRERAKMRAKSFMVFTFRSTSFVVISENLLDKAAIETIRRISR